MPVLLVVGGILLSYVGAALVLGPPLVFGNEVAEAFGAAESSTASQLCGLLSFILVSGGFAGLKWKVPQRVWARRERALMPTILRNGRQLREPRTRLDKFWKSSAEAARAGVLWRLWLIYTVTAYIGGFVMADHNGGWLS
ncbi:hypothetical protein AB0J80_38285 [Actinoplanes sp. NPDC049548]|uniref:hypothetical protein n=1 Tax=Actinoplanes sp. NPDC049548 TaxID=3155152 RepID=UPI00342E677A